MHEEIYTGPATNMYDERTFDRFMSNWMIAEIHIERRMSGDHESYKIWNVVDTLTVHHNMNYAHPQPQASVTVYGPNTRIIGWFKEKITEAEQNMDLRNTESRLEVALEELSP